jgi:hypothetical protein
VASVKARETVGGKTMNACCGNIKAVKKEFHQSIQCAESRESYITNIALVNAKIRSKQEDAEIEVASFVVSYVV